MAVDAAVVAAVQLPVAGEEVRPVALHLRLRLDWIRMQWPFRDKVLRRRPRLMAEVQQPGLPLRQEARQAAVDVAPEAVVAQQAVDVAVVVEAAVPPVAVVEVTVQPAVDLRQDAPQLAPQAADAVVVVEVAVPLKTDFPSSGRPRMATFWSPGIR